MVALGRTLIPTIVLAIGCSPGRSRPPPDDPPVFPEVDTFDADRRVVLPGESVELTYAVRNASRVAIEPGVLSATNTLSGTVMTAALQATTTFTLIATSAAGETKRNLVITVQGEASVRILEFNATPAIIEPGQAVELRWSTEGATRVTVSELGGSVLIDQADLAGTFTVQPQAATTYLLSAQRSNEKPVTAEAMVLVGRQPVIDAFTADPSQITTDPATLSWTVRDADDVSLRSNDGAFMVSGLPSSGSQIVTPSVTTEYMLLASSGVGTAVANVTVEVLPPGSARILAFAANPASLATPGQVTIDWETADANTVDLTANGTSVATFPRTPSGSMMLQVGVTTTFVLSAENGMGTTTDSVVVTVGNPDMSAPIIQHVAVPDGQLEGVAVDVVATIIDAASGVAGATLFHRAQGAPTFQSVALVAEGNDRFRATIPSTAIVPPAVEYYILATDAAANPNAGTDPIGAPAVVHRFAVSADDQLAPQIAHTPIASQQLEGQMIAVRADVTDASGVASVTLLYRVQGAPSFTSLPLANTTGATYEVAIVAAPPAMEYYLEATDTILPANVSRHPAGAPASVHMFSVEALDLTPPSITHTPIANGQQAGGAVTVTVDVTDATGVGNVTLFYKQAAAGSYTSAAMTGGGATKVAQIPAAVILEPRIDYYIEALDTAVPAANTARVPPTAPGTPYSFTVTPLDSAPPTISHTPIQNGRPAGQPVVVTADIVDASGISVATLFYRTRGGGAYTSAAMTGGPTYAATIPAASVQDPGVEYYVRAIDASPQANGTFLPSNAPTAVFTFDTGVGENEPNDTSATANTFLSGTRLANIALGAIGTAADRDYWIVDVPAGPSRYTVSLEVTSGGVGVCPSADTRLRLYGTNGTTILVEDDDDGVNACSRIVPVIDTGARALAPGRYFAAVEEDGNNATIASYELRGSMQIAVCGNGVLETAILEQCEDGNVANGDGCSSTCQIEPEGTFSGTGGALVGAINPAGDSDVFAVTVAAGQYLTASTSNGAGGCPGDTLLELYGTDGLTLIGSDDDDGVDTCSSLDPSRDTFVAQMAAGTYYLRVRAYSAAAVIGSYTLTVSIANNICGNSAIENGEQCDDGNAVSNDGCSSACQWETRGTAMGAGASFSDAINPIGNVDWYAVVVPAGYSIRAETFAPTDGTCPTDDTLIRLWQSNRTTQITSDDDDGTNRCSLLNPAVDAAVRALAAGTYYLSVEDFDNDDVVTAYVLNIAIQAPACGDGFIGGTEACDDGNTIGGDGCSAACQYEGTGEIEPNGTIATATPLITAGNLSAQVFGSVPTTGDLDLFSVVVPANHYLFAEIRSPDGGCPFDSTLRLLSSAGSLVVSDTDAGPGSCGRIAPGADPEVRTLSAATYHLEVSGTSSALTYVLDVRLMPAGCGDMYLATGEQCDDGDTAAGDGCSATCQFEAAETEPNDAVGQAMALGSLRLVNAAIGPAGEDDWYSITVPQGASIEAATHQGGPDQCPSPIDTLVAVFDSTGTNQIASDDLDGPGLCSLVYRNEVRNLNAGTYTIRVRAFSASATFSYVLSVRVQ